MRGTILIAAALTAALFVPAAASAAEPDRVHCELAFWVSYDGRAFEGPSHQAWCDFVAEDGQSVGGATATISGTWSAAACDQDERIAGRITIADLPGGPIDVDYDLLTAGLAVGDVTASQADGDAGGGTMVVNEWATEGSCPGELVPRTTVGVPGVGGATTGGFTRWQAPFLRSTLVLTLD